MEAPPWQYGASNLQDRIRKIWKKGHLHDHTIKVIGKDKSKEFKVHKLLLAIATPYFERLFYGSFDSPNQETELKDVEPEFFLEFLNFVYTDKISKKSYENAKDLFVLADRFLFPELKKQCLLIIDKHTTISNILDAFEFHLFYNNKILSEKCQVEIESNIQSLLDTPSFLTMSKDTLLWILRNDYLKVESEITLYNAAVKWLDDKKGKMSDEEEFKKLSSEIMHQIRFSCMTAPEFTCGPLAHTYLTVEDKLAFLAKLNCKESPIEYPKDYCLKKRKNYPTTDPITKSFLSAPLGHKRIMAQLQISAPYDLWIRRYDDQSGIDTGNESEGDPEEENEFPRPKDWRAQLYKAVEEGDVRKLDLLYRRGADVKARYGRNRRTLLQVASSSGQADSILWLLKRGVDIKEKNLWGWTALHFACRSGHVDIVTLLISKGADRNALTNQRKTPYDVAAAEVKEMLDVQGILD